MQNIIIAKPYEFVPPARGTFWPAVFRPLLRPYLAQVWGVTRFDIVGIETLRAALRRARERACSCRTTAGRATRWSSPCSRARRARRST